ncbi:hypothetical protein IWZ00DRAFT_254475 [Phyllosticta capitalensis]|uniref:Uncharacterized protein n=1 Tax=Phyllosticta capitalensis TaxID=121624 RepID=A0ABR1YVI4_9PEZI
MRGAAGVVTKVRTFKKCGRELSAIGVGEGVLSGVLRGCGRGRRQEGCSASLASRVQLQSQIPRRLLLTSSASTSTTTLIHPAHRSACAATVGQGCVTPPATSSQDQPRWPWTRASAPITTTAAAGCPARMRWARGRGLDLVATLPSDCLDNQQRAKDAHTCCENKVTTSRPLGAGGRLTLALPITVFFTRPSAGYLHFVLIGPGNV